MQLNVTFHYKGTNWFTNTPIELKFKLEAGSYMFEWWGASGANPQAKGAYAKGTITTTAPQMFYLYIGSSGHEPASMNAFNGGGLGQTGGGGATDIRLIPGNWDDFDSLKSRIIVAAGGGGYDNGDIGGSGGGLVGLPSKMNKGQGGTQTHGGEGYIYGQFGVGGGHNDTSDSGNGGGGGGYYGGGCSTIKGDRGGGGGSSFISGHKGCDSISNSSTKDHIIHTHQSVHYSGFSFVSTKMIDGDHEMPSPYGGLRVGNPASGSIRITPVSIVVVFNSCKIYRSHIFIHFLLFPCFVSSNIKG